MLDTRIQDSHPESLCPASTSSRLTPCYTPAVTMTAVDTLIFDLDDTLAVEEASAEAAFIEAGELARVRYGLDPRELHTTVRKTCREPDRPRLGDSHTRRTDIHSTECVGSLGASALSPLQSIKTKIC
jgi:hypothetical protein